MPIEAQIDQPGEGDVPGLDAGARRKDGLLSTGDMARLSHNTLRTVRFYEEEELLRPVQRTEGGHRLFESRELCKLRLITDLRAAGFSLDEIRDLLVTKQRCKTGDDASREVCDRLARQIHDLTTRVELLQRVASELAATRAILLDCQGCPRSDLSSQACGSCDQMTRRDSLPNATSVLWQVGR